MADPWGTPVVHTFSGFWEVAEEPAMSRIGGEEFITGFDQDAGKDVGAFVFANYVRPLNHWDDDDRDRDDR